MVETKTITVTGLLARDIERAERASFYGIFGNVPEAWEARAECSERVELFMETYRPEYYSFLITKAKSIDTTGTKIPYQATITFEIEY